MPITYDAPSNTITVTGYTEGTPCTFNDVYNADQAGGWGVVSKQGNVQYLFDAKLVIGDGSTSTWFADEAVQVDFSTNVFTGTYHNAIWVRVNAHFRLGRLRDAAKKITDHGCAVFAYSTRDDCRIVLAYQSGVDVELYDSLFEALYQRMDIRVVDAKIYQVTSHGVRWYYDLNVDVYRLNVAQSSQGIAIVTGTWNDIFVYKCVYGLRCYQQYPFSISNVKLRQNTIAIYAERISVDAYIINGDIDNWNFAWAAPSTAKVYRQYAFDLRVSDKDDSPISGATVTLKDKDGNQVFQVTTDVNGEIITQTVSRGYYDQANGDTLQDYSPHTLTIEKTGYQTYKKKFTLENKTDWEIKLAKAVGVFLDFGRPVVNLKKSDPENKNVMVL